MPTLDDFTPCSDVPVRHERKADENRALLRAFLRSGMGCACYECARREEARRYANKLRFAARQSGIDGVSVVVSGKKVYLIREEARRAERG